MLETFRTNVFKMSINHCYYQWLIECITSINQEFQRQRRAEFATGIAIIANIIKLKKKRSKRLWLSELFKQRHRYGFYYAILPSVRLEDLRFKNYTRMTMTQFEELLSIIGNNLKKQYVVREPINEEQRLILTLRYIYSEIKKYMILQY